ncbi:MAG: C39 family peptidase [Verrucomicrobiaceae bacterium]|nr:C39 family peptidase [Verrucomicrobiaceae bacterium]
MNTRPQHWIVALALVTTSQAQTSRAPSEPRPLDALVTAESAWKMTTKEFEAQFEKSRFEWLSAAKESARFFGDGLSIYNGEMTLKEAVVDFKEDHLARVSLSLYNRGDSSEQFGRKEDFEKKATGIRDALTRRLGVQPVPRADKSAVNAVGFVWMKQPSAYLLEYSFQKEVKSRNIDFRPEFIRLRIANIGASDGKGSGGASAVSTASISGSAPVTKASLVANVKKQDNGDVVILNVPMVDQGPKGYCVVATAERMFRYLGMAVDQNEMAQAAGTGTDGKSGTSPDKMYEALNKLEGRFRFRMRVAEEWDFRKWLKMIDSDYNREAKKRGAKEIKHANSGTIYIDEIYEQMDGETLKVVKTEKDKSGYGKFQRIVETLIGQGIPVMWCVQVGLLPEPEIPQKGVSGHMRLIIGYNLKTNEILFSDSWGAEHALKRMPMDQARAITDAMYYMEPMK